MHRLAYRRTNHANLHVRGFKEKGSTTTPFDMCMRNDIDRYRLVIDVIDRVEGLRARYATLRQQMVDRWIEAQAYAHTWGTDIPEVADWVWPDAGDEARANVHPADTGADNV